MLSPSQVSLGMCCAPYHQALLTAEPLVESCSAIGRCHSAPLSPESNCPWTTLSGLFNQWEGWWSSGGEWGKRWMLAFSPGPSYPASSQWLSWRGPGNRLGGCVLQGSRALAMAAHWLGPGLEAAVNLSPSPTLWPNGSSHLHRMQSVGRVPCCLGSLRSLRASWVLGAWLPRWWQLGGVRGPGPEGAAS